MFKINGISHDEELLNLCNLFVKHDLACHFILLPSSKDAVTVLRSSNLADPIQAHNEEDLIEVGRYITLGHFHKYEAVFGSFVDIGIVVTFLSFT